MPLPPGITPANSKVNKPPLDALDHEHQALLATTRGALGGDRFDAEHHHGAAQARPSPSPSPSGGYPRLRRASATGQAPPSAAIQRRRSARLDRARVLVPNGPVPALAPPSARLASRPPRPSGPPVWPLSVTPYGRPVECRSAARSPAWGRPWCSSSCWWIMTASGAAQQAFPAWVLRSRAHGLRRVGSCWSSSAASRLSAARSAMARRVFTVADPRCGRSAALSQASTPGRIRGFARTHQASRESLALAERPGQGLLVDDRATRGIDQHGRGFHQGQAPDVDQLAGSAG